MMKKSIDNNLLDIVVIFCPHLEDGGPAITLYKQFYYLRINYH